MTLETALLVLSILGGLITVRAFIKDWREEPQRKAIADSEIRNKVDIIESSLGSSNVRIAQLEKERVDGLILARTVADLSEDVRDIQKKIDNLYSVLMRHLGSIGRD